MAGTLVDWILEFSVVETMTVTKLVFPCIIASVVSVDCGARGAEDETKVETVSNTKEFVELAPD